MSTHGKGVRDLVFFVPTPDYHERDWDLSNNAYERIASELLPLDLDIDTITIVLRKLDGTMTGKQRKKLEGYGSFKVRPAHHFRVLQGPAGKTLQRIVQPTYVDRLKFQLLGGTQERSYQDFVDAQTIM